METWIAVTAVGRDRPGIVARVTGALLHLGCNLGETSMTRLRGEFAMILLVRLPSSASVADAREALAAVGAEMDLTVMARELSADEMGDAAGGQVNLPTQLCTGYYPSLNAPCVSVRVCVK